MHKKIHFHPTRVTSDFVIYLFSFSFFHPDKARFFSFQKHCVWEKSNQTGSQTEKKIQQKFSTETIISVEIFFHPKKFPSDNFVKVKTNLFVWHYRLNMIRLFRLSFIYTEWYHQLTTIIYPDDIIIIRMINYDIVLDGKVKKFLKKFYKIFYLSSLLLPIWSFCWLICFSLSSFIQRMMKNEWMKKFP